MCFCQMFKEGNRWVRELIKTDGGELPVGKTMRPGVLNENVLFKN